MKGKGPDLSLRSDEPVRAGLLRIAEALVRAGRDRVAHPTSDREEDVHAVRTTIKRLRSILKLIRPVVSETRFKRENARLRNAARSLAVAREHTIARRLLSSLEKSAPGKGDRRALAIAREGFEKDAEPQARTEKKLHEVARQLRQTGCNLLGLRIAARGWQAIEPGLRATYGQGRKRMQIAWCDGGDEAFHSWRIRVKNLYYELQLLEPVWPKQIGRMLSLLRKLQDYLGNDHDLVVVKNLLRKTPGCFGGAEKVECVVSCLSWQSRMLRRASEPLGQAIFCETPRCFTRRLGRRWNHWRK